MHVVIQVRMCENRFPVLKASVGASSAWLKAMGQPIELARQLAYCLRHGGLASVRGKQGNALLYELIQ